MTGDLKVPKVGMKVRSKGGILWTVIELRYHSKSTDIYQIVLRSESGRIKYETAYGWLVGYQEGAP